jgi:hypothetical protein
MAPGAAGRDSVKDSQCDTGMGGWKKPKPVCNEWDMPNSIRFSLARTL